MILLDILSNQIYDNSLFGLSLGSYSSTISYALCRIKASIRIDVDRAHALCHKPGLNMIIACYLLIIIQYLIPTGK